jgi:hypothetical protein
LITLIVTPGTAALVSSMISPVMVPRSVWAKETAGMARMAVTTSVKTCRVMLMALLCGATGFVWRGARILPPLNGRLQSCTRYLVGTRRFSSSSQFSTRIIRDIGGKDLDRDRAIEARVAGLVDFAHAAGTDQANDFVRTETRAS